MMILTLDPLKLWHRRGMVHRVVEHRPVEPYTTEVIDEDGTVRQVTRDTIAVTAPDTTSTPEAHPPAARALSHLIHDAAQRLARIAGGELDPGDAEAVRCVLDALGASENKPLPDTLATVLNIIREQPKGTGITAKQVAGELDRM